MNLDSHIQKQILFDENGHWDAFVAKHKIMIRSFVMKEVEKYWKCGDPTQKPQKNGTEQKVTLFNPLRQK